MGAADARARSANRQRGGIGGSKAMISVPGPRAGASGGGRRSMRATSRTNGAPWGTRHRATTTASAVAVVASVILSACGLSPAQRQVASVERGCTSGSIVVTHLNGAPVHPNVYEALKTLIHGGKGTAGRSSMSGRCWATRPHDRASRTDRLSTAARAQPPSRWNVDVTCRDLGPSFPLMDPISVEEFLAPFPPDRHEAAETLRALVRRTVPDAVEAVRPG